MTFSKWKNWAKSILWIHILSIVISALIYGFITFQRSAPFDQIFDDLHNAPYYLATYIFLIITTLSLCAMAALFEDLFGHKELRAQLVSKGMSFIGIIGTLLPLGLITMWDMVLKEGGMWAELANGMQHFGIWLVLVIAIVYAFVLLLIYFLGKEFSQFPNGWATLSLCVAILTAAVAISCFWISPVIFVFRVLFLIDALGYLAWAIWLALFVEKLERMH